MTKMRPTSSTTLRRELLTLIVRRVPRPAPGPVISLWRLERIGLLGQGHRLILLSGAVPARTIADKSGIGDAARQLTGSHRSIYPRWSERGAGRFYPSDSVRCRARNFAPEKTRSASDPDDAGPDLRSIDWCWLCPRTDLFLGWQSRGWLAASVARCGRK